MKANINRHMIARARQLRQQSTGPEEKLWAVLRNNQLGIKFRRQHPIGSYVLDFFANEHDLAIELDGVSHGKHNCQHDLDRQAWLKDRGIRMIRFENDEVIRDLDFVVESIVEFCEKLRSTFEKE